jgi:UDP-GlcNAc:undecaprenyl-phosphate GlcNAc-1-phosphate transferase
VKFEPAQQPVETTRSCELSCSHGATEDREVPTEFIAFGIALLSTLVVTAPVRSLALRLGLVDNPSPRKVHLRPIPLLGGLAIYIGVVLAILFVHPGPTQAQIIAILSAATMLAFVGVLDDGGLLHHQIKLFVAMPVAALFLVASGIRAQVLSSLFPGTLGVILDGCLTVLWVTGITAAFSILDHMDGLCAGIAGVAAVFFTIVAALDGQVMVHTLAAATLGAALGFLRWNFSPARIFMGDSGAMFLGFLMATLALKLRPEGGAEPIKWLVPLLILGVPILDTSLISISRTRRRLIPFTSPGKDHTAHRLANLGLGQRGAVLSLYALGGLFGAAALLTLRLTATQAYTLAGVIALCALVAILFLESAPYERQDKLQQSSPSP